MVIGERVLLMTVTKIIYLGQMFMYKDDDNIKEIRKITMDTIYECDGEKKIIPEVLKFQTKIYKREHFTPFQFKRIVKEPVFKKIKITEKQKEELMKSDLFDIEFDQIF